MNTKLNKKFLASPFSLLSFYIFLVDFRRFLNETADDFTFMKID